MPRSVWILEQAVFGTVVHLDEGLTTIGRSIHSTIVLSSEFVSRNHVRIHISPDSRDVRIIDLNSKNGIYVNGFLYRNVECTAQAGDRVGIGVDVTDDIVSCFNEGKYPIYLLKHVPENVDDKKKDEIEESLENGNNILDEIENSLESVNKKFLENNNNNPDKNEEQQSNREIPQQIEQSNKSPSGLEKNINDEKKEKDSTNLDLVIPQPHTVINATTYVKKETDCQASTSASIICENIRSIFGDLNPEILNTLSEETRKIAESSTRVTKFVTSEDVVCISSSEDEDFTTDDKIQRKVKSPQLFNSSANSSKDKNEIEEKPCFDFAKSTNDSLHSNSLQNNEAVQLPSVAEHLHVSEEENNFTVTNHEKQSEKFPICVENNNGISYMENGVQNIKDDLDDDEDDLFFTQKIFEDMKEYNGDNGDLVNEEPFEFKVKEEDTDSELPIKQEYYPENLDGTIINLEDDEEIDEAFESKVHDWSIKLTKSSQSFSESFNFSQIYEDGYYPAEEVAPKTRNIFTTDEDNDVEMDFAHRAADVSVVREDEHRTEKKSEKNSKTIPKLFSLSEDEEKNHKEPSTSTASLKRFHETVVRQVSILEETPKKKQRLNSRSENDDIENIRSSSSSHKTYSRKSSKNKSTDSSLRDENRTTKDDLFDKLKKEERKSLSSQSGHKISSKFKKIKDRRSTDTDMGTDIPKKSVYKSSTIARMKSIDGYFTSNHNDAEDFVEIEKHSEESKKLSEQNTTRDVQIPVSSVSKVIRGPPEIIQPPSLPVNRGKLRGISATQQRISEKLKACSNAKDLKRKWLEKPSVKKDKQIAKAIQEDRKKKLKELNDKKQSDKDKIKQNNVPTKQFSDKEKEASIKKPKVKVTQNNRGAFLTEIPEGNSKPAYKIPKKIAKPNGTPPKIPNEISKVPSGRTEPKEKNKFNTESISNFDKELAQADIVLQRQNSRDRAKSTDSSNEQRKCAAPRRNSKKVNFTSMEQHFEENNRILSSPSCFKSPISKPTKTKKVTFKLPPEIRYFESVMSTKPKRQQRESSTFLERRTIIRKQYSILDKTDSLLDDILAWSQIWLQNKHHNVNMMVFPMTNNYNSFSEYKNIVLPLLKMEFLAYLEKALEQSASNPVIVADIDYSTPHKQRDYVFAKCNTPIKTSELSHNDLALVDIAIASQTFQFFAYVSNLRRNSTCNFIVMEISSNMIHKDILKTKPKIKIRRIIDGILLHLGTFNAVHQLEETPLIQKILNPGELVINRNSYRTSSIEYKGFNTLNKEQHDILLKTYERAIDESSPNISLINGPPGTGKSVLISNLAIQLLYGNEVKELDKKILICAQSNMAVDVIAEKLIYIKQKLSPDTTQFNVVRFGIDEKVHPNVRGITLKSILRRHRMSILRKQAGQANDKLMNEENLKLEIIQLEARIVEMEKHNFQDVRREELMEMRKSLVLKKNIINQVFRPEDEKRLNKWFLENANIVCSTLSSCVKLAAFVDYFDVCIIDEATQCTEPWALMPLRFGVSSLIMVGDVQQLPATVISQRAKELGLETSLFTRIKKSLENGYRETPAISEPEHKPIFTLCEQYRMHSEISKWPNMYFYKNQLRNNPKTDEWKSSIKPFSILNLEYRQNDAYYGQMSISNNLEAEFVAKLVIELNNYIPNKFNSYGIITPYAQHREKLENMIKNSGLKDIMVNTIDSYQGIEKDVIIISNARTHGVGFLGNYQRLNVALTRPRKCLIVCGNFKNLESVPSWASLLANAKERGLYHNISTKDALDINKNVIEKIKIKH